MKIRILNVMAPNIALFMSAWLRSGGASMPLMRNVVLFSFPSRSEFGTVFDPEALRLHEESCKAAFAGLPVEWISCLPSRAYLGLGSLLNPGAVLRERAFRREELQSIRSACRSSGVAVEDVAEVWYAHGPFKEHLFYLCPAARGVRFEHGLSDVKDAISLDLGLPRARKLDRFPSFIREPARRLRYSLDEAFCRHLLWFTARTVKTDERVSLLGDEIRQANPAAEVQTLPASSVLAVAAEVMRQDEGFRAFQALAGGTALVLLSYVIPYAKTEADHLHFFDCFEEFLHMHYAPLFASSGVRNIVFKSRYFREDFAREGVQRFHRLRPQFNLIFLTDHSRVNLSAEYYLPVLRPRFMLGDYSSGLFYAKKLTPEMRTYTYEEWNVSYCRERYGQAQVDYSWLRNYFGRKYSAAFKDLVPGVTP